MAAPVCENSKSTISQRLVVTENVITKSEIWVSEFIGWKRFVVLHFEIAVNWFGELDERQWFSWEHVWLRYSDCVVFLVLLEAFHQILELDAMLVFK